MTMRGMRDKLRLKWSSHPHHPSQSMPPPPIYPTPPCVAHHFLSNLALPYSFTEVHLGPSLTHLWRVLITSPRLRLLGLDSLALQPEDVTIACSVLQHPSCKLSSIR